jgi:D-alanyl-lipoteichoic acid acyltransferase DltB (MBOAT superfamily)
VLFNTFQFGLFYIIVLLGFGLLRGTLRKVFLLGASYYFYMCWNWHYIWVVLFLTLIDFFAGLQIEKSELPARRKLYLGLSLAANLGLLGLFKYYNFLAISATAGINAFGPHLSAPILNVILPVGISFHTFQAMSYTIEVYRRKVPAEHNLLNYSLYVAFFPQMVAGPIERPHQLLPQFHSDPRIGIERVHSGLRIALWGFFKKMVIADSISGLVNTVYSDPSKFSNTELVVATVCFAIQIYCDFSGYSDIAIGLARVMGYELRLNFRQPYFSRSVGEFWHRWHISLSTWFRDYLYIPLGGNRVRLPRYLLNLFITFAASGLWHGASWTFIAWGALHGFYLIASKLTVGFREKVAKVSGISRFPRLHAVFQTLCTAVLVTVAWVFFRAKDIHAAFYVVRHLIPGGHFRDSALSGLPRANVPFIVFFIASMFVVEWFMFHPSRVPKLWGSIALRYAAYYSVIFAIILFGVFGHIDFIYFQF